MRSPVDVWLVTAEGDVRVGRAWFTLRRGNLSTRFAYDSAYLERSDAWEIDPALPLQAGGGSVAGLPGAFRDASPDRWGRHLMSREVDAEALAADTTPRRLDDVDYLLGVSDLAREGALRFRVPESDEWLSERTTVPPRVALPQLHDAANRVSRGDPGIGQFKYLLDAGSGSLGGARPKASVTDGDRILLAKFSHPGDEWSVMAWEKVALDIAAGAGMAVPRSELLWTGREQVLLLERFDRVRSRTDGPRRPYMSAMTLIGGHDGGSYDFDEVAERVRFACATPERALRGLFLRAALTIVLHDLDDHLRNIGFLRCRDGWRLAPVFDCNPEPREGGPRQTTIIGAAGDDGDEDAEALRLFGEECGLSSSEVSEAVRAVVRSARQWDLIARRNRIGEGERRLFAPMLSERIETLARKFG